MFLLSQMLQTGTEVQQTVLPSKLTSPSDLEPTALVVSPSQSLTCTYEVCVNETVEAGKVRTFFDFCR